MHIFIYDTGNRIIYFNDIVDSAGSDDVGFSFFHAYGSSVRICLSDFQYAEVYPVVYSGQPHALFHGGDPEHILKRGGAGHPLDAACSAFGHRFMRNCLQRFEVPQEHGLGSA